ncbi:MAG: carbohydrate ABC transporter permease [Treponema sp.]|nr:carbohydrate ABC transporter permease [Treponema sp.]
MNSVKHKKRYSLRRVVLIVVLTVCAVFFLYPMIFVVLNSFRSTNDIILNPAAWPVKPYFGNYATAWKEMHFPKVFLNTLAITVFGTGGIILTSALCAYALARSDTRVSWVLYGFFAFYLVIPFQIIMVPIGELAADLHLMNIPGIILMYWGLGCPTAIFMFHGFIKSVPRELEESAALDGAGKFYIFFVIVLPLIKTIVATIAVIDVLWMWNDFLLPLLVIKQGTIQLAQQAFKGLSVNKYGPLCASLTISSIPIIIFYLSLQKYIIKGIAAGAVKG